MKNIAIALLLVLSAPLTVFADKPKFVILDNNGRPSANPDIDTWHSLYFADVKGCFVGGSIELVDEINHGYYNEGDDVLHDAKVINEDSITFVFGGLSPDKDLIISRCNF